MTLFTNRQHILDVTPWQWWCSYSNYFCLRKFFEINMIYFIITGSLFWYVLISVFCSARVTMVNVLKNYFISFSLQTSMLVLLLLHIHMMIPSNIKVMGFTQQHRMIVFSNTLPKSTQKIIFSCTKEREYVRVMIFLKV